MTESVELKKLDKGFYKNYRIEKQWAEDKKGKILNYTVRYVAYNEFGNVCDCNNKLKDLKIYLDSMK